MRKKILIIIFILLFIFIFGFIVANAILNKIEYTNFAEQENNIILEEEIIEEEIIEENTTGLEVVNPEDVQTSITTPLDSIPDVTNILLIGEENVYNANRGRTDCMMILTIDKINNSIKLTSLMRDSFVEIPKHKSNRLNAAYSIGGASLLKETVEQNFGITIDNTVLVDFVAFQEIINILDGIDIELTKIEADYLNKGNYIVEEENKILKEGLNHMNGDQVLGFARIRYVPSIDGEANDFGRTNRHRIILNAIFEKYKESSLTVTFDLVNEILPHIKTDITKSQILNYLTAILFMNPEEIKTFRLPIDSGYSNVSINNMSVLQLDWDLNRNALYEFIYETKQEKENTEI